MADETKGTQGGTHEQHVHAGEQIHKNHPAASEENDNQEKKLHNPTSHSPGTQGGTHEQHVEAGKQGHGHTKSSESDGRKNNGHNLTDEDRSKGGKN